jgi:hypothetical protein
MVSHDIQPIRLGLTMKVARDSFTVQARFRPFPSRGRPDRRGPSVVLSVEPPPGVDRTFWNWNIGQATQVLTLVEVPDDYFEMSSAERYELLLSRIRDIGLGTSSTAHRYR